MIEKIQKVLQAEAKAISEIPLNAQVEKAVTTILSARGKIFTTGIGKAGYVARKAASTFSTTGTPSVFLHPGDASHGDVGVVSRDDILIAISNSGRTREVLETVHFCRSLDIESVIALTATDDSPIAHESDIVLQIGHIEEPCPFGLTPTSSTSAMSAMLDALALTTMEERGFSKADFAARHHGGYLGEKSRE